MSFAPDTPNNLFITRHSRRRLLSGAGLLALGLATSRRLDAFAAFQSSTPEAGTPLTSFLDAGAVHEIAVTFDQAVYDAMIETLADSGKKEWIEATVTIDGATYDQAGVRLKGNSSLGALGGGMAPALPPPTGGGGRPENADADDDAPDSFENVLSGPGASADEPERLPWLIRLDKFVDGQQHEGITELVVRSNNSETALNEAVALELLGLAGLATQRAAATRFTVNDRGPVLRLTIEHPTYAWMAAHFAADGLLFKAEAGGDFSYRGDDPAAYDEIFDLEAGGTGDDAEDFAPLFAFLAFINTSDDAGFAAQLPEHLDVEGFATYLAMMDLVSNFDDISGPGNNAYLYADPGTGRMTVVPWDMNLAFGGGHMVHIDGNGPGNRPGGSPGTMPPDGATPEAGGLPPAPEGAVVQMYQAGGPMAQNILVERANATADFPALVETRLSTLREELYDSGVAGDILSRWARLLQSQASDLVDAATITSESDAIAAQFSREP